MPTDGPPQPGGEAREPGAAERNARPGRGAATVIVPSRGPTARLRDLLDSLAGQSVEHETLVVDNGSPGGSVARCCERYGFATAIRLERNAGFSAAVNLAARRAAGEVLVLVNDDCRCDPGFVAEIRSAVDPAASIVMAAGVMRDARDERLIDTAGLQIDSTLLAYDYLNGMPLTALSDVPADPFGPSGAAAALDRAAFLDAGGFDEGLFAYWEDTDLAIRLRLEGGSCRLAASAQGSHHHSATLGHGSAEKNYLTGFGRGYLLRKWGVVSPRRLGPVLARELPLLAGQAVVDRSLAGARGRLAGWRAAAARGGYPAALPLAADERISALLRRRWRRRRRGPFGVPSSGE